MEALNTQPAATDLAADLITDNLDFWTSAIQTKSASGRGSGKKLDLYGIKKLRELVLELAVRGKLVPQDPNDGPASARLERIAAEKAKLIQERKKKKSKPLPAIEEGEVPFDLPAGWDWARLGEIVEVLDSQRKPISKKDREDGPYPYYGASGVVDYVADFIFDEDLVLIGEDGAKWGRGDYTAFRISGKTWVNNHAHVVRCYQNVVIDSYLVNAIAQQDLQPYITGITVPKLNQAKLNTIVIPLPPLAEQHRIVAKVDELMALCDQLEQQTEASIDAHATLVETLLATLTDSSDAADLEKNWTRIADHFVTLFTTEHSIDQLKQTVLQLAVMGKLVPQAPNDEPAAVLLEKIAAEKARLVKEKKIKKQKPLPPFGEDEKPFALPAGWEWCYFGNCISLVSGQHLKPDEYSESILENSVPYITGPAEFGPIHPTYSKYTQEKRALANPGDILITCKGSGIGKSNTADKTIAISRQLMAARPVLILNNFSKLQVDSLYDYFQSKGVGIAIPGISREDITEAKLALPPLAEQHRIVAKVDQLMTLCDQLKERLRHAQQTQLHLADALVEHAVG